jgi:hypothetical protein
MEIRILSPDLPLPNLLDDATGLIRLLPTETYDCIPPDSLRLWCHRYARYGLPTAELIAWLRERTTGRVAIEIGSGSGDLAFHLGIPGTDNKLQKRHHVRAYYQSIRQPTIHYPKFVQNLDALDAVKEYRPDVVVASWVTEWIDPNLPPPPSGGNAWGVKEDEILATGCEYILIGNQAVHGSKKIMAQPHQEFALSFLRSRANHPELDRIWIWNG